MRRALLATLAFSATAWAAGGAVVGLAAGMTFVTARAHADWLTVAPERLGGEIAGALLHAWSLVAWGLCVVAAGCLLALSARRRAAPATLALAGLVALVTVRWLTTALTERAHELRVAMLDDASLRPAFEAAHQLALRAFQAEIALALGVAIAALVAVVRRPRDSISATSGPRPSP